MYGALVTLSLLGDVRAEPVLRTDIGLCRRVARICTCSAVKRYVKVNCLLFRNAFALITNQL